MSEDEERQVLQQVLQEVVQIASRLTGFRKEAISTEILASLFAQERRGGRAPSQLLAALRAGDPAATERLVSEVMVAETFFFRHPEHFELLLQDVLPPLFLRDEAARIWSAGCASGEEAYSLAACVLATDPDRGKAALVLGTDLAGKRLEQARLAEYRNWSVRQAGPLLVPLLEEVAEGFRVREPVRSLPRFAVHNLLDAPPPPGQFDVIFCRNVLVYLDAEAARTVRAHLAGALRPGGYLFLGPLEGDQEARWMRRVRGRPDVLQHAGDAPEPRPAQARPVPPPVQASPVSPATASPGPVSRAPASPRHPQEVEAHRAALELVEHGSLSQARSALRALRERVPGYLPGMVDLALLDARLGHATEAVRTMREALDLAARLSDDEPVPGPEPLPAQYYRAVAQVFLDQRRSGS